jgi:hypothetical protein
MAVQTTGSPDRTCGDLRVSSSQHPRRTDVVRSKSKVYICGNGTPGIRKILRVITSYPLPQNPHYSRVIPPICRWSTSAIQLLSRGISVRMVLSCDLELVKLNESTFGSGDSQALAWYRWPLLVSLLGGRVRVLIAWPRSSNPRPQLGVLYHA